MSWVCPSCGPTEDRLHGADDVWHCLECDAVLAWESEAGPVVNRGWKAQQARDKAALLAKLDGEQGGQPEMPLKTGKCGRCGKRKTLQKSQGPKESHRCHKCNAADKRGEPSPQVDPEPQTTTPEPEVDVIGMEIHAMSTCARALKDLPPDSLRRVLTYLGDHLCLPALQVQEVASLVPTARLALQESQDPQASLSSSSTSERPQEEPERVG